MQMYRVSPCKKRKSASPVRNVLNVRCLFCYFQVRHPRRGTRWCSWLRHCATSRKVAGSIPDCVIGIFHWHNPSGRTMAMGSTQPLTEMSTRGISWGPKVSRCVGLTTLPPSCSDCLEIWEPHPPGTLWSLLGLNWECLPWRNMWYSVAQLFEALCYKQEGSGFDSRWCHWNFLLTLSFRLHYEYQEYFLGGKGSRCVGLTTFTTFMCRVSWNLGASNSWNPQGLSRPVMGLLYLFLRMKLVTRLFWKVNTKQTCLQFTFVSGEQRSVELILVFGIPLCYIQ